MSAKNLVAATMDPLIEDAPWGASSVVNAVPSSSAESSGHAKRVRAAALPKVFLCQVNKCDIFGAMRVERCVQNVDDPNCATWYVGRFVSVRETPVDQAMMLYTSSVFALTPDVERDIRSTPVQAGGLLNHHFVEHAAERWRVWRCSPEERQRLVDNDGDFVQLTTPVSRCRLLGVTPEQLPNMPCPIADAQLAMDIVDGSNLLVPGENAGERVAATDGSGVGLAIATLSGLHIALPSGAVSHRFKVGGLVACLRLAATLKPSVTLNDAVCAASPLFLGSGAELVQKQLQDGTCPLPSIDIMRMARVRLDIMSILFERRLFLQYRFRRFLLVDSSPQFGHNFLCVREDRIRIPRGAGLGAEFRKVYDINSAFESRLCPLSTLGLGHAGLVKKLVNCSNIYLMESGSAETFHQMRNEVRGYTSDQGTEKDLAEGTVTIIPAFRHIDPSDDQSFMFPRCLMVPGHLHILNNALEESITQLDAAKEYFESLRILQNFLSDKQLRQKFQASCVKGMACCSAFSSFPTVHIDWRWEFLSRALDVLVPLYPDLKAHFDCNKMLAGESGKLKNALIQEVERVLAIPNFLEFSELLRVIGKSVEHTAHRLEGCHCHGDIWKKRMGTKRNQSMMKASGGTETCVWKGRRGPWFVTEGLPQMYHAINHDTSDRLTEMLKKLPQRRLANFLNVQQVLRSSITEALSEKFRFWGCIPWKALGIFHCECGGDLLASKRIAAECLNEYDESVAAGTGGSMHRVAHQLFRTGTLIRKELEEFAASEAPLTEYGQAFITLQEYSLVTLVERRIEQVHALVKKFGRESAFALPPYVCAKLREKANLQLELTHNEFRRMILDRWRSKAILDEVLCLRVSQPELANMSKLRKIKTVYQCTLECNFEDTRVHRTVHTQWKGGRPDLQPLALCLPQSWQVCASYWKHAFVKKVFYSMPVELMSRCIADNIPDLMIGDPAGDGLECVSAEMPADAPDDMCVFQVVNAWPDKRHNVSVGHHARTTWIVNVVMCAVVRESQALGEVVVARRDDGARSLDVRALVMTMRDSLLQIRRWKVKQMTPTWRPKVDSANRSSSSFFDTYDVPQVVGEATSFLGRQERLELALPSDRDVAAEHRLIGALMEAGSQGNVPSLSHSAKLGTLDWVKEETVTALAELNIITVHHDDLGEKVLSLNPSGLELSSHVTLSNCLPICRVRLQGEILQLPKYELLLHLHEQGFQAVKNLSDPLCEGRPLQYNEGLRQPTSYFASLLERSRVMGKSVPDIRHRMPDGYYRALLSLPAERLQRMLSLMGDSKNAWFIQFMKDSGVDAAALPALEDQGDELQAPVLAEGGGAGSAMDTLDLAVEVPPSGWRRCLADLGEGTPSVKIYFDHFTHSSGQQRGWVECQAHGCRGYVICHGNRESFCVERYLWWRAHGLPECTSKAEHLAYKVPQQDIDLALPSLRLQDF